MALKLGHREERVAEALPSTGPRGVSAPFLLECAAGQRDDQSKLALTRLYMTLHPALVGAVLPLGGKAPGAQGAVRG